MAHHSWEHKAVKKIPPRYIKVADIPYVRREAYAGLDDERLGAIAVVEEMARLIEGDRAGEALDLARRCMSTDVFLP